jgi:hypothetical protein
MLHHLANGELRLTHGRLDDRMSSLIFDFHDKSIAPNRPASNAHEPVN